jgi:uncharacterized protein (DUF1697 family)
VNTYVAMLRGVNVSGQNPINMADLRALFVALGHQDVTTYIQSGNIIFTSASSRAADVASGIELRISADLGLAVTAVIRTRDELARIIADNPFLRQDVEQTRLHVTFLAEVPDRERLRTLSVQNAEPDEFRILAQEVYLHCPAGYGRTKLNNAFWERRLRVAAATRNWNTVTRLLQMASG